MTNIYILLATGTEEETKVEKLRHNLTEDGAYYLIFIKNLFMKARLIAFTKKELSSLFLEIVRFIDFMKKGLDKYTNKYSPYLFY